jgi:hypothetical protein
VIVGDVRHCFLWHIILRPNACAVGVLLAIGAAVLSGCRWTSSAAARDKMRTAAATTSTVAHTSVTPAKLVRDVAASSAADTVAGVADAATSVVSVAVTNVANAAAGTVPAAWPPTVSQLEPIPIHTEMVGGRATARRIDDTRMMGAGQRMRVEERRARRLVEKYGAKDRASRAQAHAKLRERLQALPAAADAATQPD